MEEKKNNSKNIIIAILIILVLLLSGFIVYDKVLNNKTDSKETIQNNSGKDNTANLESKGNETTTIVVPNKENDTNNISLNGFWCRKENENNEKIHECFNKDNDTFKFEIWRTDAVKKCEFDKIEKTSENIYKLYGNNCYVVTFGEEPEKTNEVYTISYDDNNKTITFDSKDIYHYIGTTTDEVDSYFNE